MVDTTTDDDLILPDDTGAEEALPVESKTDDESAATPTDQKETATEGDESKDESVPEVDEKLKSFAKGLGIEDTSDLSDRELKLLKVAKDNQAEFQRNRQKASELEKTLTADLQADLTAVDPDAVTRLSTEIQGLKLAQAVNSFWQSNPEAKAYEAKMTELVTDDPDLGQLVRAGYINIDRLYHIARGSDPTVIDNAKQQGGKEALQQLANKQQAKAVVGNATSSEFSDGSKPDPFLEAFDTN